MTKVEELAASFSQLDREEKLMFFETVPAAAQEDLLFATLMRRTFSRTTHDRGYASAAVIKTPNVCGGSARLVRTRIPVWLLEQLRRLGTTEAQLLNAYPTLRAEDLVQAWAYVEAHREEIDQEIADNESD